MCKNYVYLLNEFMVLTDFTTLWWTNSLQLKMAIEIVDFPINSMVDLSMAKC